MDDDKSQASVWVVPTEMDRQDVAWEVFAVLIAGLALYWWSNVPGSGGFPLWSVVPLGILVVWILTGQGAADLPFVGAIAGPLRARIGQRRAHEWAVVYVHYVRVGPWPRFQRATRAKAGAGWRRLRSIRGRISR